MGLKNQITIRDPQSAKLIQHMGYEWRPPFCSTCDKVGHQCKRKEEPPKRVQEKKKTWKAKKDNNMNTTTTKQVESSNNMENKNEKTKEGEDEVEAWTQVRSVRKNIGKYPMFKN